MAEIAAAATIIQLVQFSGTVLSSCYDYIRKAKNAPGDIQNVINDISGLEGILKRLQSLTSDPEDGRHALLKSLEGPNGAFQASSQALKELQKRLKSLTEASNARRRLMWPLEQSKIAEILNKLGEQKQTFLFALVGDHAFSDDANAAEVGKVKIMLEDMKVTEQRNKVIGWLRGADPSTNYNAARKKHESGTGDWLLHSEQFQSWEVGDGQFMWLYGIPGAGKTILSSTVIRHLTAQYDKRLGRRVAYYYFDFNDPGKQTVTGCLKSLVQQLCAQSDSVPEPLLSLYEECKGSDPSSAQLTDVLTSMLSTSSRDFIVIDALDECKEEEGEREREAFFEALASIKTLATGSYCIFITSRPELDIRREMMVLGDMILEVLGTLVNEDIRSHVKAYLAKDARMKKWPANVKEEVVDALTDKANGMFRWAVCQLDSLRTCLKPKLATIKQKLDDLPRTLEGTYERIFKEMPPDYEREMRTILMLLAFSTRPMTIQEVAEATAVDLEAQKFSAEERFPDPYDILELCSSLVSLSEPSSDPTSDLKKERGFSSIRWAPDVKMLQFAHFSVKEYILSERAQRAMAAKLHIEESVCQRQIAEMCLIYLLDFNGSQRASNFNHDEFPLLAYSSLHWITHMRAVPASGRISVEGLLVRLFDPDHPESLMNFLNLYNPASVWSRYGNGKTVSMGFNLKRNRQDFETPLYYACCYGLLPIATWLLKGSNTRLKKEELGSALGAAAVEGHSDIVQILLNEGADPNTPYCAVYHRPLHAAAEGGHISIVKLLLAVGAEVKAQDGEVVTALHLAAKQGNPEVVQLLIDAGHEVDVRASRMGNPLYLAARHANSEALAALVRNGADVNAYSGRYFSALTTACEHGSADSVRILLDAGAEVNTLHSSETPLHSAAERADLEIMRLLIGRGADVDGSGGTYGTPLKASIQSREPESFQFMLDSGADINARGSILKFPVDQAIFSGNLAAADKLLDLGAQFGDDALLEALDYHSGEYLAKRLLDLGANPNAEHKSQGNMLQFAVMSSSEDAVRWLLEAGADVNAVEGEYGTALQAACYLGSKSRVHLLLDYGAHVNMPACGNYGNALQAAVERGNESVVQLLLDRGADVNARGGRYETALQAAANSGKKSLVQLFLEKDADVNAVGGQFGTALCAALTSGHEDIARLLLEHRADIREQVSAKLTKAMESDSMEEYSSAIAAAAESEKPELIQLLLDHGVEINADGEACASALWNAAVCSDTAMLKFLIANGADIKRHGGNAIRGAVERHHPEHLDLLLRHGADVNFVNSNYSSNITNPGCALQASIERGRWDLMHTLLAAGADINLQCGQWGTALQAAIERGSKETAMDLLERGADVNAKAGYWGTSLMQAAYKGDEDLFHILLDRGADVNVQHGRYGHALQVAITGKYYDMAHELLDRGANPNAQVRHSTALIAACGWGKAGQLELIKRLVSMGTDLNAFDQERPEYTEFSANTVLLNPLGAAAYAGKDHIVRLLLELGADINAQGGTYGNALQVAVMGKQNVIVKLLVDEGANVNAVGGDYCTALQAAAVQYSDALINMLLEAGADVNTEGGHRGSPLQASSSTGVMRHVQLFLTRGAKVNTTVGKYGSPLQAAAKRGNLEIARLLLENGADVNLPGGKYGFPLQAAACDTIMDRISSNDGSKTLELLLEKGADVNAQGGKYGTALQAAAYHNRKFVEILLEHGADPNASGGKFGSPLKAARKKGLSRAVNALLQNGAKDGTCE